MHLSNCTLNPLCFLQNILFQHEISPFSEVTFNCLTCGSNEQHFGDSISLLVMLADFTASWVEENVTDVRTIFTYNLHENLPRSGNQTAAVDHAAPQ